MQRHLRSFDDDRLQERTKSIHIWNKLLLGEFSDERAIYWRRGRADLELELRRDGKSRRKLIWVEVLRNRKTRRKKGREYKHCESCSE